MSGWGRADTLDGLVMTGLTETFRQSLQGNVEIWVTFLINNMHSLFTSWPHNERKFLTSLNSRCIYRMEKSRISGSCTLSKGWGHKYCKCCVSSPLGEWWQCVGSELIPLETARPCHLVASWDAASAVCFSPHNTAPLGRSGSRENKKPWATASHLKGVLLIPIALPSCWSLGRCVSSLRCARS